MKKKGWIIGITGASGSPYGIQLCQALLSQGISVHLVITDAGWRVLKEEMDWDAAHRKQTLEQHFGGYAGELIYHPIQDIGASIASGSYRIEGMVVAPCSMGSLAAMAGGLSHNLLLRAADVMLKERRKLIVMPRETPLHSLHLENMLKLSQIGAVIVPAMPAFYTKPESIQDMIGFVVGKTLDLMGIEHELLNRWGESDEQQE